jgi:membrane fusion protein (multidrug efflux system)
MRHPLAWLTLSAALALAAGCSKHDAAAQGGGPGGGMPPPDVGVVTVRPTSVPLNQDLVGRLAAYRSADVRARVAGVLQRRVYEEGSDVKQGQVLFLIDPAPLQAVVGQAQAALAQAEANNANARAAATRARTLAPGKFISQSDLDNALAAERSAAASVQAAKAAVQTARINLGYATVRAPISGRAGKQQVTEGALVGEGTPTLLATVDQIDPLYVDFTMSVAELAKVRQQDDGTGQRQVQVVLQDGTVYSHPGSLDFSGDVVDPATGAVALRARVPNPERRLLPGTFVTLKATLGEEHNAYRVPQVAVQRDAQGPYVLIVGTDGKVARKSIVTERLEGADWIVDSGLASGDRVIVSGLQRAQPGQPAKATPVSPDKADKPAAAAPAPAKG